MNYTEKYHLPQWAENDRILMTDFNQMCAENLLPRRARNRLRVLVRLGVERNVIQKTL